MKVFFFARTVVLPTEVEATAAAAEVVTTSRDPALSSTLRLDLFAEVAVLAIFGSLSDIVTPFSSSTASSGNPSARPQWLPQSIGVVRSVVELVSCLDLTARGTYLGHGSDHGGDKIQIQGPLFLRSQPSRLGGWIVALFLAVSPWS